MLMYYAQTQNYTLKQLNVKHSNVLLLTFWSNQRIVLTNGDQEVVITSSASGFLNDCREVVVFN